MTGLSPSSDTILSIACILTTSSLQPLEPYGFSAVIHHTPAQLSRMSDWCIRTHNATGLTQDSFASTTTAQEAASGLFDYIRRYIPEPRRALLAGNSIHADRTFLSQPPWNMILEHLHYRLFDVSALKEAMRRWAPDVVLAAAPQKRLAHTADGDVRESIEEARYYMGLIQGMGVGGGIGARVERPELGGARGYGAVIQGGIGCALAVQTATSPTAMVPPTTAASISTAAVLGPTIPDGGPSSTPMKQGSESRTEDDEGFRTDVP